MSRTAWVLVAAIVACGAWGAERALLGQYDVRAMVEGSLTLSPDASRAAWVEHTPDGRQAVVVDGARGRAFDRVGGAEDTPPRLVFSVDGKHLAYVARDGDRWHIVRDGVPGREFPAEGDAWCPLDGLAWSRDGRRLAYVAHGAAGAQVFVDGVNGRDYQGVEAESLVWLADGTLAFLARRDKRLLLARGATLGEPFDEVAGNGLTTSADGRQVGYVARRGDDWFAVVDGVASARGYRGELGAGVRDLRLAGGHWAAIVNTGLGERVLYDGAAGEPHGRVAELALTPDGKRFAALAVDGKVASVLLDGTVKASYRPDPESVTLKDLRLSADGAHWACTLVRGRAATALRDGRPLASAEIILHSTFAPTGDTFAYVALTNGTAVLHVGDRQAHAGYVRALAFSPDGAHWAALVGEGRRYGVVIDGRSPDDWYEFARFPAAGPFCAPGAVRWVTWSGLGEDVQTVHMISVPVAG